MALQYYQIEHKFARKYDIKPNSGFRRCLKKQRNRKIRKTDKTDIPNIKYGGWEY
jgi:hypothetical protein